MHRPLWVPHDLDRSSQQLNMKPVRILVVDDSVVIRKLLSDTLSKEATFEVVGTAGDGRIALAKISQLHPDLVTLDIEMPVMNGLETLAEIRQSDHKIPIIMFSTLTERGAAATLEALSLGASDYATKPSNTGSPSVAIEQIRAELIPKIKALCAAQLGTSARPRDGAAENGNRAGGAQRGRAHAGQGSESRLWQSEHPPEDRTRWRR